MSPRAAWQLEALGFQRVYDFVGGKIEWLSHGLPTEGTGPHYATAGEVARRDVPTCRFDETAGDIRRALEGSPESLCVVLNQAGVILGRVRARELSGDDSTPILQFMRPGPATVRPREELRPLVERMRKAGVGTILMATAKGRLLGVVHRDDAERLLAGRPNP